MNTEDHFHIGGTHGMWNTTLLSNGTHTVMMTVYDTKGQKSSQERGVATRSKKNPGKRPHKGG